MALLATAVVTFGIWGVAAPASADVPSAPVGEFVAPLCEGQTESDPTQAGPPVDNLATVFGARLDSYNAGATVPLYDVWGENSLNGYPAVCATRFVEGVGAVSEWMFCTDYFFHVCSGVDAEGNLVDIDNVPIPGMENLPDGNPRLTDADGEAIVGYLLQHGLDTYAGVGDFAFESTARAVKDGTSLERAALQVLVWCVSDPVALPAANSSEADRAATCDANLGTATREAILALIPEAPALTVAGPSAPLAVGETAEFTVTTTAISSPLTVSTAGVAGTLAVISGPGVLNGSDLTVTGPSGPLTVVLGFTASAAGAVDLDVQTAPSSVSKIGWNQSPGVAADQTPCQVFAMFEGPTIIDGAATASFVADAGGSDAGAGAGGGGQGGGLAESGPEDVSPLTVMAALAAITGGALLLFLARRRRPAIVEG